MATLLVVGAGLFGSQAAAYARSKGWEAQVFDPRLPGAASPAAACLFKETWAGKKWDAHYRVALPILDQLYGIQQASLTHPDGAKEKFLWVPPAAILEAAPVPHLVTALGDGWLEAGGQRHEGPLYIAAGIWCARLVPGLQVTGKAGSAFLFAGERDGRIHNVAYGRQAIAFAREPGLTWFGDGTAEQNYTAEHERLSLARAAALGLVAPPVRCLHGVRPYTAGGPTFRRVGKRTWVATGGRKMGTIFGAAFARRLVEEELTSG